MIQRSRLPGTAAVLLLVSVLLSACGATPVAENWPGLTISGDTVYAISGTPQQVYLLNAETGQQKGSFMPQGQRRGIVYWSPVTVADGLAFVGFGEPQAKIHGLYAFDPATGLEQWHIPTEDLILAAPTYADGAVYFGTSNGKVYAVDVESRSVKVGWPFQAGQAVWASILVAGEQAYVASMDHRLYCLNAQTAEKIWEYEAGGALAARPVLDAKRGILYAGSFDSHVYAIHADTGQQVDGFDFQAENWIWGEVLIREDRLYVTSLDGRLYALDQNTGEVLSPYPYDSKEISNQKEVLRAAAVQAGELVLIAAQSGRVIAVKDGVRQWYWPSGVPQAQVLTTPVVEGDRIFVILTNGQIQTLQADNGVMGWGFTPPAAQ